MPRYFYDGPVKEFETCICFRWTGSTIASSENKARSNLIYQFKKQTGRSPSSKISLPGKIEMKP